MSYPPSVAYKEMQCFPEVIQYFSQKTLMWPTARAKYAISHPASIPGEMNTLSVLSVSQQKGFSNVIVYFLFFLMHSALQ